MGISTISDTGGRGGVSRSGGVLVQAEFTVDIDGLRSTANAVLGVGDVVDSIARRRAIEHAGSYGGSVDESVEAWAARYGYLLRELAREIERAGYDLRGTADAYFETELVVRDRLRRLAAWHSTAEHAP